jgi:hypothetical protein
MINHDALRPHPNSHCAEIIEQHKRLTMPLSADVLATAEAASELSEQREFALEPVKPLKPKMVNAKLPLGFKQTPARKRSTRGQ